MVAHVWSDTTEHEREFEAAVGLWLGRNGTAVHAHSIDWHEFIDPGNERDWPNSLEQVKPAIDAWGEARWRHS